MDTQKSGLRKQQLTFRDTICGGGVAKCRLFSQAIKTAYIQDRYERLKI